MHGIFEMPVQFGKVYFIAPVTDPSSKNNEIDLPRFIAILM